MCRKASATIRYTHRFYAEFAKEAMQDQSLGGTEVMVVKWSLDEPDAKVTKQREQEHQAIFTNAVKKKKKISEQRETAARATAEAEKARLERMKGEQRAHYEAQIANSNIYNPTYYQEYKPGAKTTQRDRAELHKEQAQITANCDKMNEVLQRISQNYQDNP